MTGHAIFWSVAVAGAIYVYQRLKAGYVREVVVALVSTFMYCFCLWVPAYLQVTQVLESKLDRVGFLGPPSSLDFETLAFRWSVELSILILAEFLATSYMQRVSTARRKDASTVERGRRSTRDSWTNAQTIAIALISIGVLATLAFPTGLDSRGVGGQGIAVMLRTCLITGLAIVVYFRCFNSNFYKFLVFGGTIFLVAANVRSPLVVLFLAFVASQIYRWRNGVTLSRLALLLGLVVTVSLTGSFMSSMRANLTRGLGLSFGDVLSRTFANPLLGVYEAGVDTLDGYRFSQAISAFEPARPLDLSLTVLTFIPRALWEDKPNSLSVDMSTKYLGYKSSGQFLSPVGYLNLVTGSYIIGLLGLFAFGVLISLLTRKFYGTFWMTIVLVVCFRFLLGGSSFDIYYGLVLCVPVVFLKIVVDWWSKPYECERRLRQGASGWTGGFS